MSTVSNARLIEKRPPLITAQRAPPVATDVLHERPDALLADETTTAVAKPTPALLLEADDATRLCDRDRATGPGALEEVGINASITSTALATADVLARTARARPAPRAGKVLGTKGCEDGACMPDAFACGAPDAFAFASAWRAR